MERILDYALKNNCSDIHITENQRPRLRKNGQMETPSGMPEITLEDIRRFVSQYLPFMANRLEQLADRGCLKDIDTSFSYHASRMRANLFLSVNGINLALRLLNERIPTPEELHLPVTVADLANEISGLILIVGTTGSGKSTTLASILNIINHTRCVNILTIEDPIEYLYVQDKARMEQREIGAHTPSYESAIRGAMRQDPDMIELGELRDLNTISSALTLAETGHLVFSTLHAASVPDTIDRMIDVFPPEGQEQIRIQLASVLRCVIHQRLVPAVSGGRIPLVEILKVDDVVRSMIRSRQQSNSLRDYLRSRNAQGNIHLADNVVWHCNAGLLSLDSVQYILSANDYNLAKTLLNKRAGGMYGTEKKFV